LPIADPALPVVVMVTLSVVKFDVPVALQSAAAVSSLTCAFAADGLNVVIDGVALIDVE